MVKQYSRVWAEIDLDAVRANMEAMQQRLLPGMQLCAVVKTDGYGHGAVPVAKTVEDLVWGYAVATYPEAKNLRLHGLQQPVLILGHAPEMVCADMAEEGIRPTVYSLKLAKKLSHQWLCFRSHCLQAGKPEPNPIRIHLAADTGMGRIGFQTQDDEAIALAVKEIREINHLEGLKIEGLFTHFARADEKDSFETHRQIQRFQKLWEALKEEGISVPMLHCANSAGIVMLQGVGFAMARAGITLYGLYPSEEVGPEEMTFIPALSLYSRVIFVKEVPAGTAISYGGTYVTERPARIATVSVGYGDGYPRGLSNCGSVLIRGKRAPILGRVCMDQMMVDVTEIPEVEEEDLVTLVGQDGSEHISVEELSGLCGRFNYEFVCDLGKRIPRVYFRHGKQIGTKDYDQDEYSDFLKQSCI